VTDKAQQAADFIVSHVRNVGTFIGTGEPYGFLQETALEMQRAKPTPVLPQRYIEHVAYAVQMAGKGWFLSPPAAVASVYLVTRFEFYFRVLSGQLDADGTWTSPSAQASAFAKLGDHRLKKRQISDVSLTYKLMKLGTSKVLPYCEHLDCSLYSSAAVKCDGYFDVASVGDRIAFGRHKVAHGGWGDISSEAVFYGLMTAIIFFSQ
jgi:hypothetical protein